MAADLDPIASISISKDGPALSAQGFGNILFLCYLTQFAEAYREYREPSELTADGFPTRHPAYRALAAAKANGVPKLVVGRLPAAPSHTYTLTVTTAVEGQVISCKVIDPSTGAEATISRTVPAASTLAAEATAVAALIDALAGVVASATGAVVTVTPATAGGPVYISEIVNATIAETTADANYDDQLAALALTNADFYFVTIDSSSSANAAAAASWALSNGRAFVGCSNASAWLDGTTTEGSSKSTNDRCMLAYSPYPQDMPAIAIAAPGTKLTPGGFTFALKQPKGVRAVKLTTTQRTNLEAQNLNYITKTRNLTVFYWGKTTSGEYLDITHGTDAWASATQEAVVSLLVNADKIDFDNGGADQVRNQIEAVGSRFTTSRLFRAASFKVTMPDAEADPTDPTAVNPVSDADRAARFLNLITIEALYRGAVHRVGMRATLSI